MRLKEDKERREKEKEELRVEVHGEGFQASWPDAAVRLGELGRPLLPAPGGSERALAPPLTTLAAVVGRVCYFIFRNSKFCAAEAQISRVSDTHTQTCTHTHRHVHTQDMQESGVRKDKGE